MQALYEKTFCRKSLPHKHLGNFGRRPLIFFKGNPRFISGVHGHRSLEPFQGFVA